MQPTDLSPLRLAERLELTAHKLTISQTYLAREKENLLEAKENLKRAETTLILAGLEGKNADTRNAHLAEKTISERNAVRTAEHKVIQAEAEFQQSRTEWRLACELNQLVVAQQAVRVET